MGKGFSTAKKLSLFFFLCLGLILWSVSGVGFTTAESADLTASDDLDIAFTAEVNGNWDIFLTNSDGSQCRQLTRTPFDEQTPAWGPDGTEIVFAASDRRLYSANVKTEEIKQLPVSAEQAMQPDVSPSGKIVFVKINEEKADDTDLMLFDPLTGNTQKLLSQISSQFFPRWSPDGSRIIYANTHCSLDCGRIIQELWVIEANRSAAKQLLMTNALCAEPAWSPDGNTIAFSADIEGSFDVFLYDLGNKQLRRLTTWESAETHPCWSPDGTKIVFISTKSGTPSIWIQDVRGKDAVNLRPFGEKKVPCKDVAWRWRRSK